MSVGERTIGYLPQDVMLFPQMTVRGNIEFGPKANRWSKKAMDDRIQTLSKELELVDLLNRRPHQLSGGQQKRAAMARAMSLNPDIVCLDEPFVSLDDHSKELIKQSLRQVLSQKSATVLVVTHQPQWLVGISNVEFQI